MAITKSLSLRGITVPNAYIASTGSWGASTPDSRRKLEFTPVLACRSPLEIIGFNFGFVVGTDPMLTAYEAAKSLPEFAGSVDC